MPPKLDKTDTVVISITIPRSLLKRIDDWQEEWKGPEDNNRSLAFRQLVTHGLAYFRLLQGDKK